MGWEDLGWPARAGAAPPGGWWAWWLRDEER